MGLGFRMLVGNEGSENNMETIRVGYMGLL